MNRKQLALVAGCNAQKMGDWLSMVVPDPYPGYVGPKERAAGYVKLGAIVCPGTTLTDDQILDGTFLRQSAVNYLYICSAMYVSMYICINSVLL
jgi:hypothetical protein